VLKRKRRRLRSGLHRAMAATTTLGPNLGERAALRRHEEDKCQGRSARAAVECSGGRGREVVELSVA
jgi:hypothetical protein